MIRIEIRATVPTNPYGTPRRLTREWLDEQKRIPSACTVTVYKWGPGGQRAPYTAKCYFREFVRLTWDKETQQRRPNKMWQTMPHNQIAKCAEAAALRKAFPDDLGQVYEPVEFPEADDGRSRPTVRRATTVQEMLAPPVEVHETEIVDPDRDPRDSEAP